VFTIVEIKDGKMVSASTIDNRGTHFGYDKTPAEILASSGVDAVVAQGMGPKAMQLFAEWHRSLHDFGQDRPRGCA
jgi:predicted Fe-Mo cluster-binding NifX family protein